MLQINKNRLLSLDILRGASVAGMIFVNNPGDEHTYSLLLHADWIGLTLADLVFPFFVFIMGISIAFSLKGYNYTFSYTLCKKIVSRAIILYLIGVALSYISHFSDAYHHRLQKETVIRNTYGIAYRHGKTHSSWE